MAEGKVAGYVHAGVEILGFWNECLEGDEVAAVYDACIGEPILSTAFRLWVQGRDEEAKALIPEKDHVLLEGLIMWEGIIRETDPQARVSATVKIEDKPFMVQSKGSEERFG